MLISKNTLVNDMFALVTSASGILIYADTHDNHTTEFLTLLELGLLLKEISTGNYFYVT